MLLKSDGWSPVDTPVKKAQALWAQPVSAHKKPEKYITFEKIKSPMGSGWDQNLKVHEI